MFARTKRNAKGRHIAAQQRRDGGAPGEKSLLSRKPTRLAVGASFGRPAQSRPEPRMMWSSGRICSNRNRQRNSFAAWVFSAAAALAFVSLLIAPVVSSSPLLSAGVNGTSVISERGDRLGGGNVELRGVRGGVRGHVQEQREDGWEAEGGVKRVLQGAKSSTPVLRYEGEGGKLFDGRQRCFTDKDGYHRCYPTVFFFGTSKCGTTSLARWLDAHPATHWVANPRRPHQIEQTGVKEAHVFDDPPKAGRASTQEMLHEKLYITAPKVVAQDVVIDYTPHYLAVSETPHRIADMYGSKSGLKFIVTLREPASRAISSWEFKNEFNPKKGRQEESRTLATTVREGMRRATKLDACLSVAKEKKLSNRERDLKVCNPRNFLEMPLFVSHVGKSMYAMQLQRWFDLFGRDNFKVVFTDDMAVDPVGVLQDVLEFLGLDLLDKDKSKGLPDRQRWDKITGMAYNKTRSKKKDELGEQVTTEVQEELRSFFQPHNDYLEGILGRPVPDSWMSQER